MQSPLPCPSRACQPAPWPRAEYLGGQNGKKPADSSHWLSLPTMPGEDRKSKQAQLALSPNPCPRPVLRPEGFALPGPLRRPADPDSPGRIANPYYNRSAMGMFPSAARLSDAPRQIPNSFFDNLAVGYSGPRLARAGRTVLRAPDDAGPRAPRRGVRRRRTPSEGAGLTRSESGRNPASRHDRLQTTPP